MKIFKSVAASGFTSGGPYRLDPGIDCQAPVWF